VEEGKDWEEQEAEEEEKEEDKEEEEEEVEEEEEEEEQDAEEEEASTESQCLNVMSIRKLYACASARCACDREGCVPVGVVAAIAAAPLTVHWSRGVTTRGAQPYFDATPVALTRMPDLRRSRGAMYRAATETAPLLRVRGVCVRTWRRHECYDERRPARSKGMRGRAT